MSFGLMVMAVAASVWVPWVIVGALVLLILIYVIVRLVNRPKGLAEVNAKLAEAEAKLQAMVARLKQEQTSKEMAERERAKAQLQLLESAHADKIKQLSEKERAEYEKAKDNPESGVDFMRSMLGIGSESGQSGEGDKPDKEGGKGTV